MMYQRIVKRVIAIVMSFLGMILASWLFLIITVAVYVDDPGPVFFRAEASWKK